MRTAILVTLVALLAACKGENTSDKPVSQAVPAQPPAANPVAAAPQTGSVTGKVLETMDSGGYTYLKLSVGGGEV